MEITQARLHELFSYDPETGVFINRVNRKQSRAGKEAGSVTSKGYWRIKISNKEYAAHRLAWLYVHGSWPSKFLDHRDRNPLNNRIANLREASCSENKQNVNITAANTSGYVGVTFNKCCRKWQACICVKGRAIYLGLYDLPAKAHQAYLEAKAKLHTFQPTLEISL